jgi:5-phospho-D-xylono-1,4-lactonase
LNQFPSSPYAEPRPVRTVLGNIPYTDLGITDGHNHVWIEPLPGADPASPVLNQFDQIVEELKSYRSAGGRTLLDCQPGGCGRNGNRLIELSQSSGVNIVACTGFHRVKYYAPDYWLFKAEPQRAADHFIKELTESLDETDGQPSSTTAGFIKLALEAEWESTPQTALKGAAIAASKTGAMIEIHTEKGAQAEKIVPFFEKNNVAPSRLVICHIDKRSDFILHSELARKGVLLEYDTFYRPKYQPEIYLWPMIRKMVEAGLEDSLVLATDMAESAMYKKIGGGPGLESIPGEVKIRLTELGFSAKAIQQMLGGNIARRLAGIK